MAAPYLTEMQKKDVILETARRFDTRVYVQAGLGNGNMERAVFATELFSQGHFIDYDIDSAERLRRRFGDLPHAHCWRGPTVTHLNRIFTNVHETMLFWLDGYDRGGENPLLPELSLIAQHEHGGQCCILVDDARKFRSKYGLCKLYPRHHTIQRHVAECMPSHSFDIVDDIIRILPTSRTTYVATESTTTESTIETTEPAKSPETPSTAPIEESSHEPS